jgi:hypothetical protein
LVADAVALPANIIVSAFPQRSLESGIKILP